MMNNLHQEAIRLANRPYTTIVFLDKTTDGDSIYVALNPELEGCVSQGNTPDEARQNLTEARIDFIFFLLEDGLQIPEPMFLGSHISIVISEFMQESGEVEDQSPVYEDIPPYRWPQSM